MLWECWKIVGIPNWVSSGNEKTWEQFGAIVEPTHIKLSSSQISLHQESILTYMMTEVLPVKGELRPRLEPEVFALRLVFQFRLKLIKTYANSVQFRQDSIDRVPKPASRILTVVSQKPASITSAEPVQPYAVIYRTTSWYSWKRSRWTFSHRSRWETTNTRALPNECPILSH